jgi:hypothetical protein
MSDPVACIPRELHRRCHCGQRNTVTIFPPPTGDMTIDEFTCLCGSRFEVTAIWVSGAEPVTCVEDRQ